MQQQLNNKGEDSDDSSLHNEHHVSNTLPAHYHVYEKTAL